MMFLNKKFIWADKPPIVGLCIVFDKKLDLKTEQMG